MNYKPKNFRYGEIITESDLNNTETVELIAVSSEEPTTMQDGDNYYNTETNKIYTMIDGEINEGEIPVRGVLYVLLEDQNLFYYNGTNLISVGGGSDAVPTGAIMEYDGDTVPVGYEEAEDVILTSNITGTTDNNGFLNSTISTTYIILGCELEINEGIVLNYADNNANKHTFKILNYDLSPKASFNASIVIKYMKREV